MKLGCLFSGGKDSTFAIYAAQKQGHEVTCLLSVYPKSDESHLLHHPNVSWTRLQSESMKIPQLATDSDSDDTQDEMSLINDLLQRAKSEFQIEGLLHGGIKSQFQKTNFESVCFRLNLAVVAPLWGLDPKQYMNDLLDSGFDFIITSVSSGGLDETWLEKSISKSDISSLVHLSEKYGFNLNFEGGEAETFVTNCPLFAHPIKITRSRKSWDGYRGRLEIVGAELNYNA